MILGIDIGGSAIKLASVSEENIGVCRYIPITDEPVDAVIRREIELLPCAPESAALTGVGSVSFDPDTLQLGFSCTRVLEIDAIAEGSRRLVGDGDMLTVSIGTGTAFVLKKDGNVCHIGGSAFGGGALQGLSRKILGTDRGREIEFMLQSGDLSRVDLLMSELPSCPPSLDPKLTAANLVKTTPDTEKCDWAMGLMNLLFQTLGSMAFLAASGRSVDTMVFTGGPTISPYAKTVFDGFTKAYGLRFVVPEHSQCATAIGAASLLISR